MGESRKSSQELRLLLLLSLLSGLGDLSTLAVGLLNGLDDTDSNGLTHVTDGETTKRGVLLVGLDTHGLLGDKLDDGGVTGLDELGGGLHDLTGTTVDLLDELLELACNVGSVAVKDGGVTSTDLTGVVKDNDLGLEGSGLLGGVVLRVRADVSTTDVLDGDVLDVEADVVSGETLGDLLVVHLNGLDFSGDVGRSKVDDHTGLDDTGLDTADGNCADTTDLVDVLEGETEGTVGGAGWGVDGVNGLEEGLAGGLTGLGLLLPSLVPGHVGGGLNHVVTVPSGDGDEGDGGGVVADLLDETRSLLLDLVETVLGPLAGVHLVASNNELTDTKGEGEKGVLTGLALLGDTSLELSNTGGDDENGAVSLRGTGDHVLDEVTVTGSVNDGDLVLGGLELPKSNVNGDTTLTLSLELVKNPCVLERGLAELGSLLLELLDGTLEVSVGLQGGAQRHNNPRVEARASLGDAHFQAITLRSCVASSKTRQLTLSIPPHLYFFVSYAKR